MRDLLEKYDRAVPRYTSYPTAPHFCADTSQDDHRARLGALPEGQGVSLYVHIPFCRHLCFYCGCNTQVVDREEPIARYLRAVAGEIALVASALGRRQKVTHIHFGGGTPSFAPTSALASLLETIAARFTLADGLEVAMEMDPRILTAEKAADLAGLGVTRASFGVQDFQDDVQRAVNRIQPFDLVRAGVDCLRGSGIAGINFDMIYGLPLQTVEKIRDNMHKLSLLSPDRVALFAYAHVPWFKEHQKKLEAYPLPDAALRLAMAEAAREDLIAAGFMPIGIDHFSRPQDDLAVAWRQRRLRRNFQGYTTDAEKILIGFGQTSISSYHTSYVQNTDGNREYRESIARGEFPIVKSRTLTDEDIARRAVIESIMCYGEADVADPDLRQSAWPLLLPLAADGLVLLEGQSVKITERGRPFTRLATSAFDAYLNAATGEGVPRHARAV